ncbi:MAG: hypothetical protein ACOYM0_01195 [Bacteroidales bacterium]
MDKRRMKLYFNQKVTRKIRNEKTNKSLLNRAGEKTQFNFDLMPVGTYIALSLLAGKRKTICPFCGSGKGIRRFQDDVFYCDCGWYGGINDLPMMSNEEYDSIIKKIHETNGVNI